MHEGALGHGRTVWSGRAEVPTFVQVTAGDSGAALLAAACGAATLSQHKTATPLANSPLRRGPPMEREARSEWIPGGHGIRPFTMGSMPLPLPTSGSTEAAGPYVVPIKTPST